MPNESRPERRLGDDRLRELEVMVAAHIASCTERNKNDDQRHVDNLGRMDRMNGKLDQLLDAHKVSKAMRRLATVTWGVITVLAGGLGWAWANFR
jgi:hypothetical protein